jgi:hypothetical protein
MRKGQRPSRHFRKIKTKKGKKVYLINKNISPIRTRRAFRKNSVKQEESMDIMSMLEAAGLDPKSEEGKSAIASYMSDQGTELYDAGSSVKKSNKKEASKNLTPIYLQETELMSEEDMDELGLSELDKARTLAWDQQKKNILEAERQKEEIKKRTKENQERLGSYSSDPEFLDALDLANVRFEGEEGDANMNSVYDNYTRLRSLGYDAETSARSAAEMRRDYLRFLSTEAGFKSEMGPLEFVMDKKKLSDSERLKNLKRKSEDLRGQLFTAIKGTDLAVKDLELDNETLAKMKSQDKDLGVKAENRAKFLSGLMMMPDEVKDNPAKRAKWIKENIITVPESAPEGKISRAELAAEFIKKPGLAKKIAEGEIDEEVVSKVQSLGLFTNNKNEVDERGLKSFAAVFASKDNRDSLKKGVVTPEVKDAFRTLQVDFDVKDFKKKSQSSKSAVSGLAESIVEANKKPPSSIKQKISNFKTMASRAVNPDLRKSALDMVDKIEGVYKYYENEYDSFEKATKENRKMKKVNKVDSLNLSKEILANKESPKGFGEWAWFSSLSTTYKPEDFGLKVPRAVKGEAEKKRWFESQLVEQGLLKPIYDEYKLNQKITKDLEKQYSELKKVDDLKFALGSMGVNIKGLNDADIKRMAKAQGISASRPTKPVTVGGTIGDSASPSDSEAKTAAGKDYFKRFKLEAKDAVKRQKQSEKISEDIKIQEAAIDLINKRLEQAMIRQEKYMNKRRNNRRR